MALGIQQQTQGPSQRQPKSLGHLARQSVIKDRRGVLGFQSQREDLCLTRAKIGHQWKHGEARGPPCCDPVQSSEVRQIEAQLPSSIDLFENGWGNRDRVGESRKEMQQA